MVKLTMAGDCLKRYFFWFANEHLDFRLQEICSLLSIFKSSMTHIECPEDYEGDLPCLLVVWNSAITHCRNREGSSFEPFWIADLNSEDVARKVASRAVSLRFVMELWGQALNEEGLHDQLKALPPHILKQYCAPHLSFKIKVETFCKHQTQAEKLKKIEKFSYLPFKGQVKLKGPDVKLNYIEFYGLDPNNIPEKPKQVFFGRLIADGQRDLIRKFSLKKRIFIGNTSMDPQLSLIMANQARVTAGDMVLDPFVGTGSLLVAAAYFGGFVLGSDIDFLMLHAKTRPTRKQQRHKPRGCEESVASNMEQYSVASKYLDVVVADSALPLWRTDLLLDAIITDPPYGIRESMERVGSRKSECHQVKQEHVDSHVPSKVEYKMQQLLVDLLSFAAAHLKLSGRLVFWLPVIREEYKKDCLPQHSCLRLIANSEQVLSALSSRRLLTYEKVAEPVEDTEDHSFALSTDITFRDKYFSHKESLIRERKQKKIAATIAYQQRIRQSSER